MDRTRNRWLWRFGLIVVAGIGMLGWSLRQQAAHSMLMIVNKSGHTVKSLEVKAGDQSINFHEIAPQSEVPVPFVTSVDTVVRLRYKFADEGINTWAGKPLSNLQIDIQPPELMRPPAVK